MDVLLCENCGVTIEKDDAVYNDELWDGPLCEDCAEHLSAEAYGEVRSGSFMDDNS